MAQADKLYIPNLTIIQSFYSGKIWLAENQEDLLPSEGKLWSIQTKTKYKNEGKISGKMSEQFEILSD
ncbi:2611_t:CDS:2 [Funneliformis geosporum]|uniref:8427_t:CDS:1 n=1 Tax=Funneliformis geosporum TaxID=1117311 RepID=A0A9W4SIF1_9GLOM|nr:8427_t:CDS:2 [Funneliformis geosporum]CAI2174026.1 2611_t:CDS:2 [Funneliformis geosporum]